MKKMIVLAITCMLLSNESHAFKLFGHHFIGGDRCNLGAWSETTPNGIVYHGGTWSCNFGLPTYFYCDTFLSNPELFSTELQSAIYSSQICSPLLDMDSKFETLQDQESEAEQQDIYK